MRLQKKVLKIVKISKLLKLREANLLELHKKSLLATISQHEEKLGSKGLILKLFEETHPGHFKEFTALVSPTTEPKKFRSSQVKVYRVFVQRLIKQSLKIQTEAQRIRPRSSDHIGIN